LTARRDCLATLADWLRSGGGANNLETLVLCGDGTCRSELMLLFSHIASPFLSGRIPQSDKGTRTTFHMLTYNAMQARATAWGPTLPSRCWPWARTSRSPSSTCLATRLAMLYYFRAPLSSSLHLRSDLLA
jgi:hypothetical protein